MAVNSEVKHTFEKRMPIFTIPGNYFSRRIQSVFISLNCSSIGVKTLTKTRLVIVPLEFESTFSSFT